MGKVFQRLQQRRAQAEFGVGIHSMLVIHISMLAEAFKLLRELAAAAGIEATYFEDELKNWEDGATRFLQGGRRG